MNPARRFALLPAVSAAVAVVTATPAFASEGQWHVGVGAGWYGHSGGEAGGLALGPHGAFEASDVLDLRLEGLAVLGGDDLAWNASLGATYKLDVIEWVPYVGLLLGLYDHGAGRPRDLPKRELGFSVPLGLDVAFSRDWGAGVQLRYHAFLSQPAVGFSDAAALSVLARLEARLGW